MLSSFASYLWGYLAGLVNIVLTWFGNAFSGLESFFSDLFGNLFSFFGNLFNNLFSYLGNLFSDLYNFFTGLMQDVVNAITNVLKALFQPIFDVIAAIFHLVAKLVEFLGLLLQLFLQLGHLIIAFIQGLFDTLAGLTYDGSTPSLDNQMTQVVSGFGSAMQILQLDNLAYILLFMIWIFTAVAVVKMIGSFRGD